MLNDTNDYTVDIHTSFTPDFIDYVVNLCEPYSRFGKEKQSNYAPNRIRSYFQTRFEYGFCIVKYRGDVVLTFGLDDFHGWAVVSRYLRHTSNKNFVPFLYGVAIPHIRKSVSGIKGICITQNVDQRDIVRITMDRFIQPPKNTTLYANAAEQIQQIRQLNGTVEYRGVEQYAYYIPLYDEVPPF